MSPKKAIRARLLKVLEPWTFPDLLRGEWGLIEGAIHELAHGAAFGFTFDRRLTDRITTRFDALPPILGLTEEARAFAVQRKAIAALGLSREMPLGDVIEDVWRHGQSGPVLPFPVFKLMIHRFARNDKSTRKATDKLVGFLVRALAHSHPETV